MERRRAFCADVSLENAESLAATASRVDNWILVEHRGVWGYDAPAASGLAEPLKAHLRNRVAALGRTKLLFVRRTERRARRGLCAFWGSSPERGGQLFRAEVESPDDLLELDFTTPGEPL